MSVSVVKNTLYLTLATVAQKILAFFYFLFLANVMQPEKTGVYFLVLSITTIFSVVADFGITPVIIREVAKKPENAISLIQKALGLKIPFIVLAIIGSIVTTKVLGYNLEIQFLVILATVVMAADAVSLLYFGVLRGLHVLKFESFGMFIGEVLITSFGALSLFIHPSLLFLIVALAIGSIFNAFFSSGQVIRRLGWVVVKPSLNWSEAKKIFKISFPFALAGGFSKLYSYVDAILLSLFIGTTVVGVYSIAYRMTYAFQFLPMAFVAALYPGMSALVTNDREKLAKLFEQAMWYLMIIAIPVAFGIFAIAPDLILLAGKGYSSGAKVLQVMVFVLIPLFLDFPIGSLLNAADRQVTKTVLMGATMVINIGLNFLFIPRWGALGAAIAAEISFWFLFLAGLYFVPKIIPNLSWAKLGWLFIKITACGGVMSAITLVLRTKISFIFVIPVAVIVYFILLLVTQSLNWQQLLELKKILSRKKIEPPVEEGFSGS